MASRKSVDVYEFQCPQFVDFTEVDSSPRDANQFGGFSPDLGNAAPLLNNQAKGSSRRRVYPDCKKNLPFQPTPVTHSSNNTDSDKWRLTALSKRLSKSDGSINHCSRNMKVPALDSTHFPVLKRHNRSLSESDVRAKARTFPTTPLCLKRTLYKSKLKKFKTSEELELEKIAELRKEMAKHLRANEMAMRRLKMKVRTCTVLQREVNKPELKSNDCHQVNKPKDNKGLGKLNGFRQNTSPPNAKDRIDADRIKTERAKRFQTRMNELRATVCKPLSENLSGKHNFNPTVASVSGTGVWSSLKNKKPNPYAAHPGLCFLPKQQKAKTCEPFNFTKKDFRSVQSCTSQEDIPKKDQRNVPGSRCNFTGKENNTSQKSSSEVKRVKDQKLRTPFHSKDNRI